jgi:uncharacterized protein YcbX
MQNKFLSDFLKMQARLVHAPEEPKKKDKKGRPVSKHGTASGQPAFGEVTLSLLISEKPPKKEVLQYFRDRIARLVSEDMEFQVS